MRARPFRRLEIDDEICKKLQILKEAGLYGRASFTSFVESILDKYCLENLPQASQEPEGKLVDAPLASQERIRAIGKNIDGSKTSNMTQGLETLLTPKQVKEKLQVGISTVYHLAHKGLLPGIKIGGTLRFSPKALTKYLEDLGKKVYGNI